MFETKPVHVLDDPSRGPIGLYQKQSQHSDVQILDVYQSMWKSCSAGADVYPHGQGKLDEKKGVSPYTVKGKIMGGYTIYDGPSNGKDALLYDISLKYRSWNLCFNVKDAQGRLIAEIKGKNSYNTYLTITFANAASGQHEQRQLDLKRSKDNRKITELYEGDNLIATFERPGYKFKKTFVNEPRILTISPNVDPSVVLAIYLCRHTQIALQNAAAGNASASSAGVAAAVAS